MSNELVALPLSVDGYGTHTRAHMTLLVVSLRSNFENLAIAFTMPPEELSLNAVSCLNFT